MLNDRVLDEEEQMMYLNSSQEDYHIENSLTRDQNQIALLYLRDRFEGNSTEEILNSLISYKDMYGGSRISERSQRHQRQPQRQRQTNPKGRPATKSRHINEVRPQREMRDKISTIREDSEQMLIKHEKIRLVAKIFCETGVNYNLAVHFFPKMSPQQYRCYVHTAINQGINEMVKFMRYEANINVPIPNAEQKLSIRNRLYKGREWLGFQRLATFCKLIQNFYQQKRLEVTYEQVLKLYKKIYQIIKSPRIEHIGLDRPYPNYPNEHNEFSTRPARQMQPPERVHVEKQVLKFNLNKEEEASLINLYITKKNIPAISTSMTKKKGFHSKWKQSSIRLIIKGLIKKTLKKLCLSYRQNKRRLDKLSLSFDDTESYVNILNDSEESFRLKSTLLKFYADNKITINSLHRLVSQLNDFFSNKELSMELGLEEDNSQMELLPKIQCEVKEQPIDLLEEEEELTLNQRSNRVSMKQQSEIHQLENITEQNKISPPPSPIRSLSENQVCEQITQIPKEEDRETSNSMTHENQRIVEIDE